MPEPASSRLALIGPTGATDAVADGDDIINAIIDQLEAVGAGYKQGTSRPAASAALEGYFYVNTSTGLLSYCTGSVWIDFALNLSNGQIVTKSGGALVAAYPPGYEFGYDYITTPVTVSSATEASGTTVITCAAHDFDGGPVTAEFVSPAVSPALVAGGGSVTICLFEGATEVGRLGTVSIGEAGTGGLVGISIPVRVALRMTPSVGSHTYTVKAFQTGGNGTIAAGSNGTGGYAPTAVRFLKV